MWAASCAHSLVTVKASAVTAVGNRQLMVHHVSSPTQVIKDYEQSLFAAGFVPAMNLHLSLGGASCSPEEQLLRPEVLALRGAPPPRHGLEPDRPTTPASAELVKVTLTVELGAILLKVGDPWIQDCLALPGMATDSSAQLSRLPTEF